jgi:hypothetical protein
MVMIAIENGAGSKRQNDDRYPAARGTPNCPVGFPLGRMLGVSVRLAAAFDPIMLLRLASPTSLRTAESRTLMVEGESVSMPAATPAVVPWRETGWHGTGRDRRGPWRSCAGVWGGCTALRTVYEVEPGLV